MSQHFQQQLSQLGSELRSRRLDQYRTIQNLSSAAGVSVGSISSIERGMTNVRMLTLIKICEALEFNFTISIR